MSDDLDGSNDEYRGSPVVSVHGEVRKVIYYEDKDMSKVKSEPRSPSPHKTKKKFSRSRSRSRSRSQHKGRRTSKYRSRSRTPRKYWRSRSRSDSRSRSGSYSPSMYRGRDRGRSYSRSPMSSRRRHNGSRVSYDNNRDNPEPNRCLGVFGLNTNTDQAKIQHIFNKYGIVDKVDVVIDAKTKRSRGFCFVYFRTIEDARMAKEQCSGMEIDGRRIRVDYSITLRAHTPTPGIYMGKPTSEDRYRRDSRDYGDYYGGYRGRYRSRSPRKSRRRRYDRSHSRSYSPRRY